ncbi:MAG: family 43 glycosylhydrolase, partial [Bacteroidota bacterium]|nr:family 43 glycosylhydrolase [Bacteroidota bacterium]
MNLRTKILFVVIAFYTMAGGAKARQVGVQKGKIKSIVYQNPIKVEPIRDPQILLVNGTYYMTGTSKIDAGINDEGPGVKLFSSKNLTEWKFEKILIKPDGWYRTRIWAPEIHK